ncbi:MAG: mRNA surveillance protein pelota [DPANN group archaeon]|nr:mRNA surveillance protein pelota [DPANN group archaeon]
MRIIHFNKREGVAKLKINLLDDLWHLSKIIEPNDLITGRIERKIKFSGSEERAKAERKFYTAKIRAARVQLESTFLKIFGEITEGSDELSKGAHTLDVKVGFEISIEKDWKEYQIKRLRDAEKAASAPKALICALDDEQATLAALTAVGISYLGQFQLGLAKKRYVEKAQERMQELVAEIIRIEKQSKPDYLILASPLFWKEELLKKLQEKESKIGNKVKLENVSAGSRRGIVELLHQGVLDKVIKQSQLQKEFKLVENLVIEIARKGLATYKFANVKNAVEAGAVDDLLLTDSLIADYREKNKFEELEQLIDAVEGQGGKVNIISSDNEAGDKLDGLGGIAVLLRFKI